MDASGRQEGPRPFRSRRDRPCDACRGRKIACRIDSSPPCAFCAGRGNPCTFQHGPNNKRRKVHPSSAFQNGHHLESEGFASFSRTWEENFTSEPFDSTIFDDLELGEDGSPASEIQSGSSQATVSDGHQTSTSPHQGRHQSLPFPAANSSFLDNSILSRGQVPPETGHLSSHVMLSLMGHRRQVEVSSTRVERTRASNEPYAADEAAPILLVKEHPPFLLNGPTSILCLTDVETLLSERQRQELVRLFFRFVQPAFPVLHDYAADADSDYEINLEPSCTSLALSICIYATALPFSIHNDYLNATLTDANGKRERLYSMAVAAILQEVNSPTLETLQACLLLLQKGPTTQHQGLTPTYSCFSSLAAMIAKSLGLQHDCSSWNIPHPEKRLRHRLWWATFVHDMWISVDTPGGRTINSQDYDVPLLGSRYGLRDTLSGRTNYSHFDCLVTLTHLLSQIHETYYTIRASKDISGDLFRSLEFAKPLRSALNECKQKLKVVMPLTAGGEPGASGSVLLANCVTEIILFRALLRPIRTSTSTEPLLRDNQMSAAAAVLTGSINCAKETVDLLETMVSMVGPWTEFWHSWSQGNFAIVSTFLVQLNMMTDTDNTKAEVTDLISRWKRAIRIGAGSGGWGSSLMSMALSRLDSLLVPAFSAK